MTDTYQFSLTLIHNIQNVKGLVDGISEAHVFSSVPNVHRAEGKIEVFHQNDTSLLWIKRFHLVVVSFSTGKPLDL